MEQVVGRPLEDGIGVQRGVEGLDDALRAAPTPFDDPRNVCVLVGQLAARYVDTRDLEEGDALGAELEVAPYGVDEARQDARAEHRHLGRHRLGHPPCVRIRIIRPQ